MAAPVRSQEQKQGGHRSVQTLVPRHMYLEVTLEVMSDTPGYVTREKMDACIQSALLSMFGKVGSQSLLYDRVGSSKDDSVCILRAPVDHYEKIWGALTMFSHVDSYAARFTIGKATPYLFALRDERISI